MSTWSDLKFGARMVRKAPGASLIAALALGLGIGANTAIFSIANGILLHPLPYAHLDRLMFVGERPPHTGSNAFNSVSAFNYAAWQKQTTIFQAMTAYRYDQMNLSGVGTPAMVQGAKISTNFFSVLPARLLLGRAFLTEEGQPGNDREVILGKALWQRQFNGDPSLIGRTIELDQQAFTVVGVVNESAAFPQAVELWMPLALSPQDLNNRTDHNMRVIGELKPGATLAQAFAEMSGIAQRIDAAYPATNRDWGVNIETLADREIGNETAAYVYLLLGATGFLLLIACANVANLQFARALGRNHELAIRTALGAGRGRLMRQLLSENLVLGLGGAAVGVSFAAISIRLILAYMPADVAVFIGGWDQVRLNGAALAFTLAVALLAGIFAGLAPAWHASSPDINSTLKEGGRGAIGHSRRRLRAALVAMQVALALVLLVGAGLMVKGFNATLDVDRGWEPVQTLTAAVNLPGTPHYTSASGRDAFWQQSLNRLANMPGATAASVVTYLPLSGDWSNSAFSIQGRPISDASQVRLAVQQSVTPEFFAMLHVPILQGRNFTASDGTNAPGVAIISQVLAKRYWPNQSPLGQQVKLGRDDSTNPWLTVVGVVPELPMDFYDTSPEPALYRPLAQAPQSSAFFLVRGAGDGDATRLGPAARQAVAGVDPNQPLFSVMSLAESIHENTVGIAYVSVMLTVAGILALILAAVGVYGVMAFLVSERVHEIGIRRALGASQGAIVGLVLRRGAVMLGWGFVFGLPVAFLLARGLQNLIVGVGAGDLATYLTICVILAAMAALACYVPARQATLVDPLVALREP